jgi:hypothetical protein
MSTRKLGMWAVVIGVTTAVAALVVDGAQLSNNHSLVSHPGALALSRPAGALVFIGLGIAALGAVLVAFGPRLYDDDQMSASEGGTAPESAARARTSPGRLLAQIGIPALVVALVAGATALATHSPLGQGTNSASRSPASVAISTRTPTTPSTVAASEGGGTVVPGSATGNSPCEKALPTPSSPGEVGNGSAGSLTGAAAAEVHGARGLVVQQPLTEAQRELLQAQMAEARTVVAKYPTVAAATAGGYHISTVYVPCIGAHYTNIGLVGSFDPARPSELLYDGTRADSKIVGLSYLVWHPGGPPPGFAGPNDHWHQHNTNGGLCLRGALVVGGEETSQAQCTASGGRKTVLGDIWMVHAWVVPGFECSWGVFSGECPELGGKIGGTAWSN